MLDGQETTPKNTAPSEMKAHKPSMAGLTSVQRVDTACNLTNEDSAQLYHQIDQLNGKIQETYSQIL